MKWNKSFKSIVFLKIVQMSRDVKSLPYVYYKTMDLILKKIIKGKALHKLELHAPHK